MSVIVLQLPFDEQLFVNLLVFGFGLMATAFFGGLSIIFFRAAMRARRADKQ